MAAIKFIISILFLILVAFFSVKNMHSVGIVYYDLKFQPQSIDIPLMVVVLVPFVVGFLFAWFFGFLRTVGLQTGMARKNREINTLSAELDRLKTHSPSTEAMEAIRHN